MLTYFIWEIHALSVVKYLVTWGSPLPREMKEMDRQFLSSLLLTTYNLNMLIWRYFYSL